MDAATLVLPTAGRWRFWPSGAAGIAVAERDALGTTARVAAWPVQRAASVLTAVGRVIERLDRAASRFRADSELTSVHAHAGTTVPVSDALAEAVRVALSAARWTGGLVDPTVGSALIALGYDRDFAAIDPVQGDLDGPLPAVPGWQRIRLASGSLRIPAGVTLDLGATAKGLGADWAAEAAQAGAGSGGVLVSLGGDVAMAGAGPAGGWPVLIADDHRQRDRAEIGPASAQRVRLSRGAVATSSVACRRWRRSGRALHHILDPRTGLPAAGPWRTASVAAATCAEANAASTAAIIMGGDAPDWLAAVGLPARLVCHDGAVTRVGGWPAADDAELNPPPPRMPAEAGDNARLAGAGRADRQGRS